MPLSTFSSSESPPEKKWWLVFLVSIALTLLVMGAVEWRLRRPDSGYFPATKDSPALWASIRKKVESAGKDDLVIVGSSRLHVGMHLPELKKALGNKGEVHQLAISAGAIFPVLEELAENSQFRGKVLLEFHPLRFAAENNPANALSKEFIHAWQDGHFYDPMEISLRSELYERFIVLSRPINIKSLIRALAARTLPKAPYLFPQPSRWNRHTTDVIELLTDAEKSGAKRGEALVAYDNKAVDQRIERIAKAIAKIEKRGGEVIVFRVNSSGLCRDVERERFPRTEYYDRAKAASKGCWLHFEDDPELSQVKCTDGSHVMGEEASRDFTKKVADFMTRGCGI